MFKKIQGVREQQYKNISGASELSFIKWMNIIQGHHSSVFLHTTEGLKDRKNLR